MEDNTHHNLWECDMVLMSSTCRKLKQLIFSFIGAKTTITNCDLIEETSIRDNLGDSKFERKKTKEIIQGLQEEVNRRRKPRIPIDKPTIRTRLRRCKK